MLVVVGVVVAAAVAAVVVIVVSDVGRSSCCGHHDAGTNRIIVSAYWNPLDLAKFARRPAKLGQSIPGWLARSTSSNCRNQASELEHSRPHRRAHRLGQI